jgi:hypothetical protein
MSASLPQVDLFLGKSMVFEKIHLSEEVWAVLQKLQNVFMDQTGNTYIGMIHDISSRELGFMAFCRGHITAVVLCLLPVEEMELSQFEDNRNAGRNRFVISPNKATLFSKHERSDREKKIR